MHMKDNAVNNEHFFQGQHLYIEMELGWPAFVKGRRK